MITPRGSDSSRTPKQERITLEETLHSLKAWERFRSETDLAGLNLFWFGDSLKESLLPKTRNLEVFRQWEALAQSLDSQVDQSQTEDYILPLAFRDTIALAVSLGSAFILTYQPEADFEKNLPPEICQALEAWGVSCSVLTLTDPLVSTERNYLRQLLISTGTSKFFWSGLHLTVLHIFIPEISQANMSSQQFSLSLAKSKEDKLHNSQMQNQPWLDAKSFWYLV